MAYTITTFLLYSSQQILIKNFQRNIFFKFIFLLVVVKIEKSHYFLYFIFYLRTKDKYLNTNR